MIELRRGNLLTADVEALVNTVNTVGAMGKGVALQFRQAYPDNYAAYQRAVRAGRVEVGRMFVFETGRLENPRLIINFPTKRHWRGRSRLEYIDAGLVDLRRVLAEYDVRSVAIPALGCGNGGLRWEDVSARIVRSLEDLDLEVLLFPPGHAPSADSMPVGTTRPALTAARAALIILLARYLEPGAKAGFLEVQKLANLLQEAGEPLRLTFAKGPYGPYAEAVNHVLQAMEGHYIRGYGDRAGAKPSITLVPGAVTEAEAFLVNSGGTVDHIDRVTDLIAGYETPYGLELLTTTLWVTRENPAAIEDAAVAVRGVQAWSRRKGDLFGPQHVGRAWARLREAGWLGSRPREPEPV
jgi:O-acetyl-ADP-ribose deacetylase (regulator of RNase III)